MGRPTATILAGHLQENLRGVATLGEANLAEVRERISSADLHLIESTAASGWLPTDLDRLLVRTIRDRSGAEGVTRVMRRTMQVNFEGPVFAPVIGELRARARSPSDVMEIACAAYPEIHRDNGTLLIHRQLDNGLELLLADAPPSTISDDCYLHAFGVVLQCVLRLVRAEGTVQLIVREPDNRAARFVCCAGPLERPALPALPKRPPVRSSYR